MHPNLRRLMLSASLFFILATAHAQPVQPYRPAPIFQGKSLPEPPHQSDPWTPPATKLPEKCVSSIQALVRYGFANPRGCEYREVELPCGGVWGDGYVFKTHAWVLPEKDGNSQQRFAVSWSGLIYPAVSVGGPADLKTDVEELVKKEPSRFGSAAPDESSLVWHQTVNSLKVCMLTLVGETGAAEEIWQKFPRNVPPLDDPYLEFAHEYAWAHYDRAVCAHMRGDDVISLISAQIAARLQNEIAQEMEARSVKKPPENLAKPNFDFLKNIGTLVADEERRVKGEKVERVLIAGVEKFPDQKQRIAALIRDLEDVSARQWGQPGGVDVAQDKIMQALIKEGEPAVEPLMQCFETDARLTRSVSFGRDFFPGRHLISVDEAAYRALGDILKVRTFGPLTQHGYSSRNAELRKPIAEEISAYWNKVRGVAETDRWYETLADDKATREQWLETVRKIVRPAPRAPGAAPVPRIVTDLAGKRAFAGEILREKKGRTVTELLVGRADELVARSPNDTSRIYLLQDACEITLALAQWQPEVAASEVQKRIAQCKTLSADNFYGPYAKKLAPWVSRLCAAGMDIGDPIAADEYVIFLSNLSPERLEFGETTGVFYALCRFPDQPKLAAASRPLFLSESPYQPLHTKVRGSEFREYVGWPLIGVPEFRQMVKKELRNVELSNAKLKMRAEDDSYNIEFAGTSFGQAVTNTQDPAAAKTVEQPLRVCDLYAWSLAKLEGAPLFEPFWPQDRRDAAIAELIALLDKFGDCYRLLPSVTADRIRHPFREVDFHLPKLDHAATADDEKNGRAIFSLQDGKSEVRLAELPTFPQMARWKTLDKFPIRYRGQKDGPTEYDRAGYIWQAEEILVDGKWQRFYGFVGNHIITKAPAEEIEFLQKYGDDRNLRW